MTQSPLDAFAELTAEVTALRREINAKTMDKKQADELVSAIRSFSNDVGKATRALEENTLDQFKVASVVAKNAAAEAMTAQMAEMRAETLKVAQSYSKAAGEARQAAWRYFGGFWVWLGSMLLLGVVIGAFGMMLIRGNIALDEINVSREYQCRQLEGVGDNVGYHITNSDGAKFCAVKIKEADKGE